MSGAYSGLQASIKEVNPLAEYSPCAAHSLNLVGSCAANCCEEACHFFELLQAVYCFFTASTHCWEMLNAKVTLKDLSETRWSAREDACRSLNKNWDLVIGVLKTIILDDTSQKPTTRCEAKRLLQKLNRLECALMAVFWGDVLEILNKTSKKLQSVSIDLITVVQLYDSIIYYVKSARSRNRFMDYESSAKDLSGLSDYKDNEKRKRRRKLPHGETRSNEVTLSGREHFIVMTYFFILDNLQSELQKRKSAYDDLIKNFPFFII